MGMPELTQRWTAAQVRALPDDGNRYELVSGELLVTPAPRPLHQICVSELMLELGSWLRAARVGKLLASPADLSLGEDEVLQPDLFVYRSPRSAIREWREITDLLLVIEVLSPATARYDRLVKRQRYQRAGVSEFWIVDIDARLVERWTPGETRPEVLAEEIAWHPTPELPPLVIDLTELFRRTWGEI